MPQSGSLAFVYPTAARAGIALQALQDAGITFTNTQTVQRIMQVKTFWLQLVGQPWFGGLTNSLDAAVRQLALQQNMAPSQNIVNQAVNTYTVMSSRVAVHETAGVNTRAPNMEVNPKPGEIWCYDVMYGSYTSPGVWCCSGTGTNCWVQRPNGCPM
jgi:hypothetical protein